MIVPSPGPRARGLLRRLLLGAALVVGVVSAGAARADAPKKAAPQGGPLRPLSQTLSGPAKADFEAAKLLANDGDFAGAIIKFQSAYDASKDPRLLWNVAFCQKNMRHYAKVIATLRRYLDEGSATLSAADKKDAQDLIAMIEPFTTRATLRVSEDGAQITVDDEPAGVSPLAAPVLVDLGEHKVRVAKEGFVTYEKPLSVGGAADATVDIKLEKVVHEGRLVIEGPTGSSIFIDDKQVASNVEQVVVPGGHQVRVSAPGMRTYQSEIVIQDKETRSVNVVLEREAAPVKPTLRVAVGCRDVDPKGPEDGLVVYLDGPDVLPPGPVKRVGTPEGQIVVENVEYSINPGRHTVRVSIPGCWALDLALDVDPAKGADITGALPSSVGTLVRGPQGSPGWGRVGIGPWFGGGTFKQSLPTTYNSGGLAMTGAALDLGLNGRWFGLYANAAYGTGSFGRDTSSNGSCSSSSASTPSAACSAPDSQKFTSSRLDMRFGPRFPFNVVSLGLGLDLGFELVSAQGGSSQAAGLFGGYSEIDIQPLCDWGLYVLGGGAKPSNDDDVAYFLQFGAFFGPSPECHRERETDFSLRAAPH